MSTITLLLARGERGLIASGHGDVYRVTKSREPSNLNQTFSAILDTRTVISPDSPLGLDSRQILLLRIITDDDLGFENSDVVVDTKSQVKYLILDKLDPTPEPTTDYVVQQQP